MKNILIYPIALLFAAGFVMSCDNILEPSVDQEIPTETAIENVGDLNAVVLGIHDELNEFELFGRDFYVSPEVMSDNAWSNENSGRFINQRDFNFPITHSYPAAVWNNFYVAIAGANIAINAELEESGPDVDHAKGQAYALRGFSHMNLLLAFGQQFVEGGDPAHGIPYVTSYADEENQYPHRDSIQEVWENIIDDLNSAENLLNQDQFDPTLMNYYAVKGLQSRLYLYTEDYDAAIAAADAVIDSGNFALVSADDLVSRWASGSGPNSLFELAFTDTDRLATDNIARIYLDSNYGDVEITADLYHAYEEDDVRRELLSDEGEGRFRMTGKYRDELGTDNVRIIRYAEVLLNKAEALAKRNNAGDRAEALSIINELSAERGSSRVYSEATPENVLAERRLELAMEGQRLFDLARHGLDVRNVDIPSGYNRFNNGEDLPYGDYRYALPIPNAELNANGNMDQNVGY